MQQKCAKNFRPHISQCSLTGQKERKSMTKWEIENDPPLMLRSCHRDHLRSRQGSGQTRDQRLLGASRSSSARRWMLYCQERSKNKFLSHLSMRRVMVNIFRLCYQEFFTLARRRIFEDWRIRLFRPPKWPRGRLLSETRSNRRHRRSSSLPKPWWLLFNTQLRTPIWALLWRILHSSEPSTIYLFSNEHCRSILPQLDLSDMVRPLAIDSSSAIVGTDEHLVLLKLMENKCAKRVLKVGWRCSSNLKAKSR